MFVRILILAAVVLVAWAVVARDSGAGGPERTVTVRAGDTLWSIAEQYFAGDPREGVWLLEERNDLPGAVIVPGQRLVLP
ncbi:MAG TPA: LysM peptidoglycan-binding domain-containing protein [Gaiellaceae bacterium]|nr:LysM peptidoglycan-binding domain-containing protein [Gaiellaceae bacterium]